LFIFENRFQEKLNFLEDAKLFKIFINHSSKADLSLGI